VDGLLYHSTPHYSHSDGIICLHVEHLRPRRLIEIGSDSLLAPSWTQTGCVEAASTSHVIEPHPELLRSLVAKSDDPLTIIESKLQEMDIQVFDQLESGDVLFIDSTHISKEAAMSTTSFLRYCPLQTG